MFFPKFLEPVIQGELFSNKFVIIIVVILLFILFKELFRIFNWKRDSSKLDDSIHKKNQRNKSAKQDHTEDIHTDNNASDSFQSPTDTPESEHSTTQNYTGQANLGGKILAGVFKIYLIFIMLVIIMSFFSRCVMLSFISSSIKEAERFFNDVSEYQIEEYLEEF